MAVLLALRQGDDEHALLAVEDRTQRERRVAKQLPQQILDRVQEFGEAGIAELTPPGALTTRRCWPRSRRASRGR